MKEQIRIGMRFALLRVLWTSGHLLSHVLICLSRQVVSLWVLRHLDHWQSSLSPGWTDVFTQQRTQQRTARCIERFQAAMR
mmetsp:Transcript_647/g.1385  ORF Transcript_647/g.1385 Transcript_647/m.1385 type:complete len:81 (+) Transcript_647:645-887(+)